LRIISSKDVPVSAPGDLNRQPHSEQPKPRKRGCSIHTNFRLMATDVAAPQRRLTACLAPSCRRRTKHSPFIAAYCLIAVETCHQFGRWLKVIKRWSLRAPIWTVCRASYIRGRFLFVRPPFLAVILVLKGRFVWKAKAYKRCSLESGLMLMGNQSAI
jgi:hypothetical protein